MTTTYRGYEKPDPDNTLLNDCQRLQNALDAIDTDVNDLLSSASSTFSSLQASTLLTTIKTVDGTGSGLDADLLDGLSSGDFAPFAHVGAGGTSHADVTSATAGFMTAVMKTKLDGIATGAQVNTVVSVAGKVGAVTLVASDCSAAPDTHIGTSGTSHAEVTTATAGYMAAADKIILNSLKSGRLLFNRG